MPLLFRDYETYSAVNLRDVGAWRYATHGDTGVWCCAYAVKTDPVKLWTPGAPVPLEFIEAAQNPSFLVSAFNDQFERLIEQHIMGPRYGWPLIPIERHRCSQAAALALALPATLEKVALALGLEQQKDRAGHDNMLRMSRPRKPKKEEEPEGLYWHDDQERRERLYSYCKQDVETERALHARIGHLSPEEQAVWILDATVNDRGIHFDRELAEAAIRISGLAHEEINAELKTLTEGAATSLNQTAKLIDWLAAHGCVVANVQKETLRRALTRNDIPQEARRLMELRLDGAHAAANKFKTMVAWQNPDGRIRGAFKYHGASTGRWSSLGVQLHNMKRPLIEDMGAAVEAVATGDLAHLRGLYPQLMSIIGDITRAVICARPGYRLIAADFSGVESRITAWLSGQQSKLDQWAKFDSTRDPKDDPYFILGLNCDLPCDQARDKGKTADLAFGYQGGEGAYRKLAPEDPSTSEEIKRRQQAWRTAHPATVRFWGDINRAAIKAVQQRGKIIKVNGRVTFECDDDFLRMKLPSGRQIAYPFPRLMTALGGDCVVVYMDNQTGKWVECRHGQGAYGGTWTENAVQAVARDLFAAAMPRLEAAGYPIVLHVHDEIVAEVPLGFGSSELFLQIITMLPDWTAGLPVAAKVWEGERFIKLAKPKPVEGKLHTEPPAAQNDVQKAIDGAVGRRDDDNGAPGQDDDVSALKQFRAAIEHAELTPPEILVADGELHRFSSDGRPGKDAGWYVLHLNGIPSGVFGCFRAGVRETWQARMGRPLTAEENAAIKCKIADAKQKQEAEKKKVQAEARALASRIWDSAAEAPANHPYLIKKAVGPHGLRLHADGRLIVPLQDTSGVLHSLQFIAANGAKQFLTGGTVSGCHFILGKPNGVLGLCEGFATGATILEDVGHAVAIGFNAGNLPQTAEGLRVKFAGLRFLVCADDDATVPGNPGMKYAVRAATILDGSLAVPRFGVDRPQGASDFNDLHQHAGPDAVRACLEHAVQEQKQAPERVPERPKKKWHERIELNDFRAYMPLHNYLYIPSREPWPASSVNARIPPVPIFDKNSAPIVNKKGEQETIQASAWLDQHRPVEQMTWAPGLPKIIQDRLIKEGGWVDHDGASCFNLYLPPRCRLGNASKAAPWLDHVNIIYGDYSGQILPWFALKVQRPEIKINHALVFGGLQGIGKDTLLEPVKQAVGSWNFQEVSPRVVFGRFNGFLKSVIIRVSEARDLGDEDRFQFYEHMKTYIAAPPDVLRVDEKHLREHAILNCCGVIITTNHKADGIFLPSDDRRHFVAWCDLTKDAFTPAYWSKLWGWYEAGGFGHVAAYLTEYNISTFDPKAPPPKTQAFWDIVDASRAPEEAELADVFDKMGNPNAATLAEITTAAAGGIGDWLRERKNRRTVPYRLEQCGYVPVRNDAAKDGLWKINDARQVIYAKNTLTLRERHIAAVKKTAAKHDGFD